MALPSPFQVKVGDFILPTVDGPINITGVGFKPKALILFGDGNDVANTWQGATGGGSHLGMSVSIFTEEEVPAFGDPDRRGVTLYEAAEDGHPSATPGAVVNSGLYQKVYRVRDSSDTLVGEASFVSFDVDGFTLDFSSMDGKTEAIVNFIALGGESLTAKVVKWTLPNTYPGTQDITVDDVGFRPNLVLHVFGSRSFSPTPWLDAAYTDPAYIAWRIGAMDDGGREWGLSFARDDGFPTNSKRSLRTDRAMYGTEYQGLPAIECEFRSMDADGFTMRAFSSDVEANIVSLCLGGIRAHVGTIEKPTATGSQATTGVGFRPRGLILASVQGAANVEHDGVRVGLGAASGNSARRAIARVDIDNVNTTESQKHSRDANVFYGPNYSGETTHADLTSFDAGGFTLAWTTNVAASYPVAFIAVGARELPLHLVEMELNGLENGWTDVTPDVLLESPLTTKYGIAGTGPVDLVASTGLLKFTLNNSEENEAGVVGYYSPGHENCRPGFRLGIRVRYTYVIPPDGADGYGKFIGRLRDIDPEPGRYRDRKTVCQAADWMNEAAITRYNAATQTNQRGDELLTTIVGLVQRQPESTAFDVGNSTFPYAFDNGLVERSSVLTEIQRICQSEYGRCYVKGALNDWGILRFESRTARLIPSPVAVFDGTMRVLSSGSGASKVKNKAKAIAHPRRVDTVTTKVLFAKPNQNNPSVLPGATLRMSGRYVDVDNPNARIGGVDMQTPTATTDYLMNSAANGSGSNLTANFTVVATYGANQVDYAITNNGGTTGFVTKLQARGRGLYDYDPLEAEEKNEDSIDQIGESGVTLDMPYQSDFETVKAIALFIVETWSSHEAGGSTAPNAAPGVTEITIKVIPRTDEELTALMALEPGDAVTVIEWLAVVNDVYFIQSVGIRVDGDSVSFEFDLQRALVQTFWTLGVVGKSELGVSTVLAPL